MERTSKEQMMELLIMLQTLQRSFFGTAEMEIDIRLDEDDNAVYICVYGYAYPKNEDTKTYSCNCYYFWDYEENIASINKFKDKIMKDVEEMAVAQ